MGVISWFFSLQEVLQSQPFFMLVLDLPPCRSLVALISDPKSEWLALTSDLDSSERHNTYIWPWLVKKALSPRLRVPGNWPGASIQRMAVPLTSDLLVRMVGTNIWPTCQKGGSPYMWSCRNYSYSHIRTTDTYIWPTHYKGGSPYIYVGSHPTSEWTAITSNLLVKKVVALTSM